MCVQAQARLLAYLLPIVSCLSALRKQERKVEERRAQKAARASKRKTGAEVQTAAEQAPQARKGPRAVIVSPSRELAGQIQRALGVLASGLGLTSVLLKPASAAGADFAKVASSIMTL